MGAVMYGCQLYGPREAEDLDPDHWFGPTEENEMMSTIIPREVVQWFAQEMEKKLLLHDDRPGWRDDPMPELFNRLIEEAQELNVCLTPTVKGSVVDWKAHYTSIIEEAADVANFAMMIADIAFTCHDGVTAEVNESTGSAGTLPEQMITALTQYCEHNDDSVGVPAFLKLLGRNQAFRTKFKQLQGRATETCVASSAPAEAEAQADAARVYDNGYGDGLVQERRAILKFLRYPDENLIALVQRWKDDGIKKGALSGLDLLEEVGKYMATIPALATK